MDSEIRTRGLRSCRRSAFDLEYWNGWWDVPEEGNYTDINDGAPLHAQGYKPWFPGEPNG